MLLVFDERQDKCPTGGRLKEHLLKLAGVGMTVLIFLYLLYSFRSVFLFRFGVFGLVVPAGFFFFMMISLKEICDIFSVLTVWSMADSSASLEEADGVSAKGGWRHHPNGVEDGTLISPRSGEPKKVRFVGLPPCPPKRLRRSSESDLFATLRKSNPASTPSSSTRPAKPDSLLELFIGLFQKKQTFDSADEFLTGAWGTE